MILWRWRREKASCLPIKHLMVDGTVLFDEPWKANPVTDPNSVESHFGLLPSDFGSSGASRSGALDADFDDAGARDATDRSARPAADLMRRARSLRRRL
jgi:hypothetical protein